MTAWSLKNLWFCSHTNYTYICVNSLNFPDLLGYYSMSQCNRMQNVWCTYIHHKLLGEKSSILKQSNTGNSIQHLCFATWKQQILKRNIVTKQLIQFVSFLMEKCYKQCNSSSTCKLSQNSQFSIKYYCNVNYCMFQICNRTI